MTDANAATDEGRPTGLAIEPYLSRLGLDPDPVPQPTRETLERLQRAHVLTVPFENLAIVGDPRGDSAPAGVSLDPAAWFEKLVERERGGYCFECNGLFHHLLGGLGFDVDRVAACIVSDDDPPWPANHHANLVHLDRSYVVDVGMGTPPMRRPTPLDGATVADDVGVSWRVVESDRPDATHRTEYRAPGEDAWTVRYRFETEPRDLSYFEPANDHLQRAPESSFTGDPIASIATADGYAKLAGLTLTRFDGGEKRERTVDEAERDRLLSSTFGLSAPS
ncbi:arylamine N-acetyltransferase family protein [Halovivax limisalsi]|uniref:arylamine N-acetyltransferase family protein n=1 Tax=Halovivax limisalsi TaxID=1453760 RepID=UPI001FFDC19F|nr:arylamine N-acetyltransferase [Halovivax limisalsi]